MFILHLPEAGLSLVMTTVREFPTSVPVYVLRVDSPSYFSLFSSSDFELVMQALNDVLVKHGVTDYTTYDVGDIKGWTMT